MDYHQHRVRGGCQLAGPLRVTRRLNEQHVAWLVTGKDWSTFSFLAGLVFPSEASIVDCRVCIASVIDVIWSWSDANSCRVTPSDDFVVFFDFGFALTPDGLPTEAENEVDGPA